MKLFKPKTAQEQTRKMFFDNLDRIYKTSKDICKLWETKTLPLESLKEIIKQSKPSIKGIDDPLAVDLITQFNNTIDKLYDSCYKAAFKMKSKKVPLSMLKNGIDLIKTSFNEGMNKKPN
jgi:hypothetical protein